MNRKRTALIAAALLTLFAIPALAADSAADLNGGIATLVQRPGALAQALKLTKAQTDTLKGLTQTLQTTLKSLQTANAALDQQIKNALASPAPDNCALGKLMISRHQNDLAAVAAFAKFDKDFSAILTAEQLAKWQRIKNLLNHSGKEARDADEG
jgi:Spy/CpxP family protein refolding chaperone